MPYLAICPALQPLPSPSSPLSTRLQPAPPGFYLRSQRCSVRQLLAAFDSDGDGCLDPLDVRRLVVEVMPGVTAAQLVYIRVGASCTASGGTRVSPVLLHGVAQPMPDWESM